MVIVIILGLVFVAWIAWGYFSVKSVEMLGYEVVEEREGYEIRQYDDYIVAEVEVEGEYRDALNDGFRRVADYIFGNNQSKQDVAMTTPVVSSEKVAMTTPVIRNESRQTVAFVMPSKYTLETLPRPVNEEVKLRVVEGEKVAVLKFSWWASEVRFMEKRAELEEALKRDGLEAVEFRNAQYNPPWTPPFMNRNEVWAVFGAGVLVGVKEKFQSYESREDLEKATFAAGCFWCTEAYFQESEGVEEAISGYTGGNAEDPSYEEVIAGGTGHREGIRVYYDSESITYEELLEIFWNSIDPIDDGGQYTDRGFSYTTVIFYHNEEQKRLAEQSKKALEDSGKYDKPIATEILPYKNFYPAEAYHQDFYKHSSERYQRYKKGSGRQ